MCGFLLTSLQILNLAVINERLQIRGPDHTNVVHKSHKNNQFTFIHNLLHIDGDLIPQPYTFDGDSLYWMFDGSIYQTEKANLNFTVHDLYSKYRENFTSYIDGDFASVLVDFKSDRVILSTDVFQTKPLWFGTGVIEGKQHFGVSSYGTPLKKLGFQNVKPVGINVILILDLNDFHTINTYPTHTFDFMHEHKNHTKDWDSAFLDAVAKRAYVNADLVYTGLSSGYDSGGVHAALVHLQIQHDAYAIRAREFWDIVGHRLSYSKGYGTNNRVIRLSDTQYQKVQKDLLKQTYPYKYSGHALHSGRPDGYGQHDQGAVGQAILCKRGRHNKKKIFLSGFAYDFIYRFNHEYGRFPKNLTYPVAKNAINSYGVMFEIVLGRYGHVGRYPFYDKQVFQEFLWLSNEIKQTFWKVYMYEFFMRRAYPMKYCRTKEYWNCKKGFSTKSNHLKPK